jgi:hypothetical protein
MIGCKKPLSSKIKIDTKFNLNTKVLKDLCDKFGFDYEGFKGVESDIDQLLDITSCIAHGENTAVPNLKKITEQINCVKNAMDILLKQIDVFLERKTDLINNVV